MGTDSFHAICTKESKPKSVGSMKERLVLNKERHVNAGHFNEYKV